MYVQLSVLLLFITQFCTLVCQCCFQ